jgi:8-oxo-dGTP pyrophosphatase MutT (NUDIX family)
VLLIGGRNPDDQRIVWIMPGGGIEQGESVKDAGARELLEETPLRSRSIRVSEPLNRVGTLTGSLDVGSQRERGLPGPDTRVHRADTADDLSQLSRIELTLESAAVVLGAVLRGIVLLIDRMVRSHGSQA